MYHGRNHPPHAESNMCCHDPKNKRKQAKMAKRLCFQHVEGLDLSLPTTLHRWRHNGGKCEVCWDVQTCRWGGGVCGVPQQQYIAPGICHLDRHTKLFRCYARDQQTPPSHFRLGTTARMS